MSPLLLKLAALLLGVSTLFSYQTNSPQLVSNAAAQIEIPDSLKESLKENPLPASDQLIAQQLTETVKATEWLGPLAPIALSPFFGITCLAAISQFGGDYLPLNTFMSTNPVLNNPTVLWVFLGLTILTSLPRLTKISKPAAQAIDQLETYAGIITILVIRFLPGFLESGEEVATAQFVQMGIFTFSADVMLSVFAVINIIVINAVKFFFEMLVWLVPFPFVDAGLEITNKSFCAALMTIYAWSPLAATIINLILFAICLVAFRWIKRRVAFMRAVIGDPIWSLVSGGYGKPTQDQLIVFPKQNFAGFPAKTKLILRPTQSGWRLLQPRFWGSPKVVDLDKIHCCLTMREGLLINTIDVAPTSQSRDNELGASESAQFGKASLLFSRRYRNQMGQLVELICVEISDQRFEDDLKTDFASG